jgi:hypothetical protein
VAKSSKGGRDYDDRRKLQALICLVAYY